MSNRIYVCAAILLIIGVLAFLAYRYLEIYPKKAATAPASYVAANSFYALEQWLKETGHSVLVNKESDLEKIAVHLSENSSAVCIIFASACNWNNANIILKPWIEQGGYLVICIDNVKMFSFDENLLDFLYGFGIEVQLCDEDYEGYWSEDIPNFNRDICFSAKEDAGIITMTDSQDHTRLTEVSLGEGKLTVIGFPHFMQNWNLEREINARLAWELTGARAAGGQNDAALKEILFIRDRYIAKTLFGKIMERGNILPLGISAILLIFIGFWMVVPVFGLVLEEKQKNSRPIRERFAAEIGFLKKHKALNYYLETYEKELLKDRLEDKQLKKYNYWNIIKKLRSVTNATDRFKHRIGNIKT